MKLKSKRGVAPVQLVFGLILLVVAIVFFSGGGLSKTFEISKFLTSIPAPIWVFFGVIVFFRMMGRKK